MAMALKETLDPYFKSTAQYVQWPRFRPVGFWARLAQSLGFPSTQEKLLPNLNKLLGRIPPSWDRNDFILTGSAPLAFRGVRDVRDLDILVSPKLYSLILENPGGLYQHADSYSPFVGGGLDIFDQPPRIGLDFYQVRTWAENFHGYWVQHPAMSLATKALVLPTRDKDRQDIIELSRIVSQLSSDRFPYTSTYRTAPSVK